MDQEKEKDISIKDVWRLKHYLNKGITYGGMNAKEVKDFKRTSSVEWQKVRTDYGNWIKQLRIVSSNVLIIILIFSGLAIFYFSGWIKTVAIVVVIYCIAEISKREGHREGYFDGYDAGKEEGINKTLGIDNKEAADVHERAIEMEIDEKLANQWDKEDNKK